MKKFKKLFLVLALVLFASAFAPLANSVASFTAYATPVANFSFLTIENFVDEANVGSNYVIQKAKVWNNDGGTNTQSADQATVTVKDPVGKDVTLQDESGVLSFNVTSLGEYSIIYSYNGYSQALKMNAKEGIYSFKFDENSQQIFPQIVNIQNYTGKIVLPNPTVVDEDGNEIADANVVVEVTKPTSLEKLTSSELVKNNDGFYEFTANVEGTWSVKYIYMSSDNRVLASEVKTFTANKTYNNDYKLVIVGGSKPTTAVTGVAVELPSVTGKNSVTEDQVNVYYTITAERVVYDATTNAVANKVNANACIDGNTFTPDQDGDYIITYNVKNFFGTVSEWEFEISDVKDTQAPEVKIVDPYTTTPTDADATYKLPEQAGLKNIVIPAIWAEDNVDKTLESLTLTRKITKSTGTVIYESSENPNKALVFNHDAATYTLAEGEIAATLDKDVTFGAGTYNVTFTAKDSAGNETTSTTYKLVITDGFVDDEKPEIKWSTSKALPNTISVGKVVSFPAPVVTDNVSTRYNLVVEYQFVQVGDAENAENWTAMTLENNNYSVTATSAEKLLIRATATDSYGNSNSIKKEITIRETNDTQATMVISTEEAVGNVYNQNNEITLRSVSYSDDYADYVQFSANVTVEKDSETITLGTYKSARTITYGTPDTIEFSDTKVWASYAGDYKVSYVTKDLKNNYTLLFYTFNVTGYTETAEIELTKLPDTLNGGSLELGEEIEMPVAEISIPSNYTAEYFVNQIDGPTAGTIINKEIFYAAKVGTYVIEYSANVYDEGGQLVTGTDGKSIVAPVRYTVEVVDTTKPVIGNIDLPTSESVGYELTIPQFTAFDLSGIDAKNSKVVLSSKSTTSKTLYYDDTTSNRTFVLSNNEVYTLTFTVKDNAGNTTTLVKTINIGDTEAPVITVDEEDGELVPETIKLNGKLTIDLSKISVSDVIDTEISKDDLIIVVERKNDDSANETIANIHGDSKTKYEYNIEKTGEYVVKISVKDEAGNESDVITRNFTVSAAAGSTIDKNEVVGTVLIVVSVLILAGVIVYFIVSKKKTNK